MVDNNQKKFLVAVAGEIQAVEDALQQLYSERSIDVAVGVQLDILGKIVGQRRNGMVDDDYRRIIRARIATNRSKGTITDLITVARLVVNDEDTTVQVDNVGNGTVVVRLLDEETSDTVADLTLRMLKEAVSGGVRIVLEWSSYPVAEWLQLDLDSLDDHRLFSGDA